MRTFIAIELPKEIKDALSKLQQQLKSTQADVKWVAPENIHLTLKFLGEVEDKNLESIIKIINELAKNYPSFLARIFSIGAFPKLNYPRVIWVGIDKGDDRIKEIANELENRIAKLGIPKESRPFSSHITIGRTRSTLNRERLAQELNKLTEEFGQENLEFSVAKITLYKSILTPKGPIYEVLNEAHLRTT
jgi:2'-5' RNA ligase